MMGQQYYLQQLQKKKEIQKKDGQKMSGKNQISLLANYKALKATFVLPLKIKLFYSLLEDLIQKNSSVTSSISKDQTKKYKHFITGFKRLSEDEQARYLFDTLKLVKAGLVKQKDKEDSFGSSQSDALDYIKDIETTCKVKQSFLGFTKYEKRCFKLNTKNNKIKLIEGKKETIFSLAFYLIRKSTKHAKTLTLFSISENFEPSKSEVYIYFDDPQLFEQIYNLIFNCITELQSKQILRLASELDRDKEQAKIQSLMTINDDVSKASVILTTKVLNQYFQKKDKILKKIQDGSNKFENFGVGFGEDTKVGVCKEKNKDRIKIEKTYNMSLSQLVNKLSILNRKCDGKLIEFQVLQTFTTNIQVVYFKYYYNSEVYEFLTILEECCRKGEQTLFLKGIDNFINQQFVDFLCFRLKQTDSQHVSLKLMGIIKKEQKNKNQAVGFLLSLIQPTENDKKQEVKLQQFWTVREMDGAEMDDPDVYYGNGLENQEVLRRSRKFSTQQSKTMNIGLFNKIYIVDPSDKPVNKFLTEHPLFKEWKLHKSGGVICTNEQQINHQKKVFKYIISQIGSNIIQRKNILNVSFPVTIFKKQSHLKSVARNFSFAPIFFEKVINSSPEEKIKAAVLFQISTAILVISMNKPFNPILGQTYQGFIDDCPVFLEQISHHPPVSRYMFDGRGYKIYGTIEPKIAVGLNCVKGWSPPLNYIKFDDGTQLQFTMNKMVINGMLFGERTFNFEGINFVIDHKNKLMAQICYGIQSNNVFKKKDLTYDSVSGAVYKFSPNFEKISAQLLKKNDKEKLAIFNGTWHSEVSFDGKAAYNFYQDLPHELIDYENPIPSDSCYRTDLLELIKNNLEGAQKQKQFLEQIQRRDKKLRQNCRNSIKTE